MNIQKRGVSRLVVPLTDWFSANLLARGRETIDLYIYLSIYLSTDLSMYIYEYKERDVSRLVVPLTDWFSANVLARGKEIIDISIHLSIDLSIDLPTYLCVHMYVQRNIFIPAGGPADRLVLGKRPRKG